MTADAAKRYRVPLTAVTPSVAVCLAFLVVLRSSAVLITIGVLGSAVWRQRFSELRVTPDDAVARQPFGNHAVRWREVTAVERGSRWSGGLILRTRWERVRCPAPCSWWGGPATAAQTAEIERWWRDHGGTDPESTI